MSEFLPVVLRCADAQLPKVRYVIDTLLMAGGVPVKYCREPPPDGPWIFYGMRKYSGWPLDRCLSMAHCPESWRLFEGTRDVGSVAQVEGLTVVLPERAAGFDAPSEIPFDLAANAFYFLSSWSERVEATNAGTRKMYPGSVFARLHAPQDIVDQYLRRLLDLLGALCQRLHHPKWAMVEWPLGASYGLVLSHDVDFLPRGLKDVAMQGARTVLRHLVRQADPGDALRAAVGFARALAAGRDVYGCVSEIIEQEKELGVRSSFQVAVAHRHASDVNYRIEDDRIRKYLRAIQEAGFEVCLHGSYRSTENPEWYIEEVGLLTEHLCRPVGSRQHFLSFDYDALFGAQERSGIRYDMSMGFPDRTGPRAGFSYPYFPYCLKEDRPFDVLQISLFLMDVTLRGYLGLKGARAWDAIAATLSDVRSKRGCVSVVWHPIVFGGARDPGFDRLYWDMVKHVRRTGGVATDGRTINSFWRERARAYPSFALLAGSGASQRV